MQWKKYRNKTKNNQLKQLQERELTEEKRGEQGGKQDAFLFVVIGNGMNGK
jgi:hypothetical protein